MSRLVFLPSNHTDQIFSLNDRTHRVHILQQAHAVWVERSAWSRDALHASKVLRAILNKVESPISISTGSATLIGETTPDVPGVDSIGDIVPPDLTPMQISDYPVNFDDIPSVDSFFNNTSEGVDWVSSILFPDLVVRC